MNRPLVKAVVMGGSAGSLEALSTILGSIPAGFQASIFITVHVPSDRKNALVEVLQSKCQLEVREAEDKEPICPATVYVAPPDYHLLIEKDGTMALSSDEPVFYSRPAIDVLFESAADIYGPSLVGIVLSGANEDGANGLRAIQEAGGMVLVQDASQAYASAMPEAALAACSEARMLSVGELSEFLKSL
ncbi:chemotaxis protein CheB [Dyella jejuensis]|uniref:protein-glutamate methylesterase n=1 Tax=Dyella jejuensis TaxID=1432009 RepID=A0ABW8JK77_9GAMM